MLQFTGSLTGAGHQENHSVSEDAMLTYFLSALDVRVSRLLSQAAPDSPDVARLADIRKRIADLRGSSSPSRDNAWTDAYGLERELSLMEPAETLLSEIQRRLGEAESEKVAATARLRADFMAIEAQSLDKSKTPPEVRPAEIPLLRSFLLDILEELHWSSRRRHHARPIQKRATRRVVSIGLLSFLLCLLPYVFLYIVGAYSSSGGRVERWVWLPLYTALTAGLFGAFFSRLMFVQSNADLMSLDELHSAGQFSSILLRGSVGMCGALIVFFFLQSGIIEGNLFPDFGHLGLVERLVPVVEGSTEAATLLFILPSAPLALLFIWCFLAGFSERLVPSILTSTDQAFVDSATGLRR